MVPRGLGFGWRRVLSVAEGGPASWLLAATLAGGASATMAHLDATAPTEQAETTALVARMMVAPTSTRRTLIDGVVAGLKADGVRAKLDWLVVTAAHDAQAGRLNWRANKTLSAVNSPPFTVDRGYAGDAASAWLDLGEAYNAGSNQFAQNSATLGVWCNLQSGTAGVGRHMGDAEAVGTPNAVLPSSNSAEQARLNSNTSVSVRTGTSRLGHRTVSRSNGGTVRPYFNGAALAPVSSTATGISAASAALLRTGGAYGNDRLAAAYSGAGLSDGEVAALHGRLNTFLTAIGAQ